MRFSLALSLMPLAGLVGAIQITEPEKGADVKASGSLTVKWTWVNTDAQNFDLYLVNNAAYPPVSKKIASDVKTSDGSYTIDSLSGVSAGSGFQVNFESDETQNTGILAQSQQFNVTGSAQSSSSSSSSSMSSTSSTSSASTSSTSTGTSTTSTLITVTGTSTSSTGTATGSTTTGTSGTASSTHASASASASQTAAPNAAAALKAAPAAAAALFAGVLAFGL
ncbi:GPI-anchored membrane protein [Penicillium rolfsii]|nr:GPI-anchored membrane protein [Penicillium rolfsii]